MTQWTGCLRGDEGVEPVHQSQSMGAVECGHESATAAGGDLREGGDHAVTVVGGDRPARGKQERDVRGRVACGDVDLEPLFLQPLHRVPLGGRRWHEVHAVVAGVPLDTHQRTSSAREVGELFARLHDALGGQEVPGEEEEVGDALGATLAVFDPSEGREHLTCYRAGVGQRLELIRGDEGGDQAPVSIEDQRAVVRRDVLDRCAQHAWHLERDVDRLTGHDGLTPAVGGHPGNQLLRRRCRTGVHSSDRVQAPVAVKEVDLLLHGNRPFLCRTSS